MNKFNFFLKSLLFILLSIIYFEACSRNGEVYTFDYLHTNIVSTYFYAGETWNAGAWNINWVEDYGGVDSPENRNGYLPSWADWDTNPPGENPFYFALPYDDFENSGERKSNYKEVIPWASGKTYQERESAVKNRWIEIHFEGKICYAQWEDVGPNITDDEDYVFGTSRPKNLKYHNAGLDVSPAVKDYLGLTGQDYTDWRFIEFEDVPTGPWKIIITTSNVDWD